MAAAAAPSNHKSCHCRPSNVIRFCVECGFTMVVLDTGVASNLQRQNSSLALESHDAILGLALHTASAHHVHPSVACRRISSLKKSCKPARLFSILPLKTLSSVGIIFRTITPSYIAHVPKLNYHQCEMCPWLTFLAFPAN